MAGRGKETADLKPYWQRASTRLPPARQRAVAISEPTVSTGTARVYASTSQPAPVKEDREESVPEDVPTSGSDLEEWSDDEDDKFDLRFLSPRGPPAQLVPAPATLVTMDSGGYVSTTKIDRFSGRPGTVSLREFKACFYSMMDEWEMKLQQHYTQRYSFKMLARYLTEEAQLFYFDHKAALLRDISVPNPAYAAAIQQASQVALQAAVAAATTSAAVAAGTPVPTSVTLTPAQLLAATQGIDPTVLEPVEEDPVGAFFVILEREFPTKSTEKIQELRNIIREKGETLKMLYRRVLRLVQETGSATPQGAAQKFLRALRADPVLHAKVKDIVFHNLGDAYTCEDVYLAAERYEMANAHYEAHEDDVSKKAVSRDQSPGRAKAAARGSTAMAKRQFNSKTANAAIATSSGGQAFGCNYCASTEHFAPQCLCPPTSLHCNFCDKDGHVEAVCFNKHPERRTLRLPKAGAGAEAVKGAKPSTSTAAAPAVIKPKKQKPKAKATQDANQAEVTKAPDLTAELEALKAQVKTLTVSMAARSAANAASTSQDSRFSQRYGLPYDACMAFEEGNVPDRATRWREYRQQLEEETNVVRNLNFHERPQPRGVGVPNRAMAESVLSTLLPLPDYYAIGEYEAGAVTRFLEDSDHEQTLDAGAASKSHAARVPDAQAGPVTRSRGARAALPMSFTQMTAHEELEGRSNSSTPPELRTARDTSLPVTSEDEARPDVSAPGSYLVTDQGGAVRSPVVSTEVSAPAGAFNFAAATGESSMPIIRQEGSGAAGPAHASRSPGRHGVTLPDQDQSDFASGIPECLTRTGIVDRIMGAPIFSLQDLRLTPQQVMQRFEAEIQTRENVYNHVGLAEQANMHDFEEQAADGTPPLVPIFGRTVMRRAALAEQGRKDSGGDFGFVATAKAAQLIPMSTHVGMELLYQNKPVSSASLHNLTKGLPVVPADERMTVNLGAVLVDNREGAVTINGLAPCVALLDTGAQPVILGKAFAIKLGLVGNALQDSAWRIRTAGGQVEKVQGETIEFLSISFNPGTVYAVELRLRCLVTSATSYDVLIGQEFLFPPGVTIDNWIEQAYYRVDWQGQGRQLGYIPLDLHGMQMGNTALSALKEACTSTFELLMPEDCEPEEEFYDATPVFAAAVQVDYKPETIQLLKTSKVVLQQALDKLEAVTTKGEPQVAVQPVLQATIQWQPPSEGIILVELFGGIAAGLEAVLKSGMRVQRYVYCDNSVPARLAAAARLEQLQQAFPTQLHESACAKAFTTFPQDVMLIQKQHLQALGDVHLIVAGWECQGLSQAGIGKGLADDRTGLFADLMRLLGWAQELNPNVAYILENTPAQFDSREEVRRDFTVVKHLIGEPLLMDAVQCGSYAHRLRNMWTNLAPTQLLQLSLQQVVRDPALKVADILDDNSSCKPVLRTEKRPWVPVNKPGSPRAAWPTLVAYPGSHAFRGEGTGLVQRHATGQWETPTAEERERAMGFQPGTTAHRKLTQPQRKSLLGRAMDMNALSWLVSTCLIFQMLKGVSFSSKPSYSSPTWHPDFVYLPCNGRFSYMPAAGGGEFPSFHFADISRYPSARHRPVQGSSYASFMAEAQGLVRQGSGHPPDEPKSAADFAWTMGPQLKAEEKAKLHALLTRRRGCFAFSMKELGRCNVLKFKLNLTDNNPIFKRRHRLSKYEWELVDARCKELYEAGLIRPSSSSYAAATVLPAKKDSEGLWTEKRMCGDYRPLNQVTPQDRYPMPTPEEIFDSVGGSRYFSILDLRQGFNQILLEEEDCCKTAFHASNQLWEWLVMPFGLKNAPVTFQRVMDQVLRGSDNLKCYVDDVLVHSNTFEDHLMHLEDLFRRLEAANMRCHPSKCELAMDTVVYLGHRIVPDGIMPHLAKVDAINKVQEPQDVSKLRAFIGLCNYYRVYVPEFSRIAKPLYDLLKKEALWVWDESCQAAFDKLKQALTEQPLLRRPDFSKRFILHTDWSSLGIGAVLSQQDEGNEEHVVAYASRSNNKAESNYSSYEGECLAVVWAVQHFRPYLYGQHFTLFTDHQPLRWLMVNDKLSGKLARWALILQEYDFEVVHRPGVTHQNADTLSRNPGSSSVDLTDARMDFDEEEFTMTSSAAFLSLLVNAVQVSTSKRQDIWQDANTMHFLQQGEFPAGVTPAERDRIKQRAKRYSWRADHLLRMLQAGERVVPAIHDRPALIQQVHADLGHFGVKRTYSLLAPHYHWMGMYTQVRDTVARCVHCDRVRSSFNDRSAKLQPLPIQGLFYRWSCDLAGELPKTPRGNVYIMVMAEHFSKWVELVALPDKSSHSTSQAFLNQVLSRFGACAECLTDQGTEFRGEFQDLLDHALIDHRRTSRDHPQADGLAERMVQTIKRGLRKFCLSHNKEDWDLALPYLAMGYRMSRHASLGEFSPYYLLFGRHPLPSSSIAKQLEQVVDLDSPTTWVKVISERAALFKRAMPMAMENLRIAQHRDTLRYAYTRGGSYRPKARKFEVGDFVYMQQQVPDTLGTSNSRMILRVHSIKPTGILVLQGKDGRTISQHPKNCAPCHLPNLDTTLVTANWIPPIDHPCQLCNRIDDADQMLLCDNCNKGFHLFCLQPELTAVPDSLWFCPPCLRRMPAASTPTP